MGGSEYSQNRATSVCCAVRCALFLLPSALTSL
jgi:hypothetical protein